MINRGEFDKSLCHVVNLSKLYIKKWIQDKLTLSTSAVSSTNIVKFCPFIPVLNFLALFSQLFVLFGSLCNFSSTFCLEKNHVSHVTSHMSQVTCHIYHVTFHLSVTNANSHRPYPAKSPIIHSRLVPDPKSPN